MIGGLILFFLFAGIAFLFRQPAVKGKCGELFIAWYLKFRLDKNKYTLLNDVMLPDNAGGTTQIDHVVLSRYGIFVIETKNMKGWIFGDRKSEFWTQQIYKCKNRFQNPFFQNYKHICCLAETTGIPVEYFIHVVIFVGECTIKTRDKLPEALVENVRGLERFIASYQNELLSDEVLAGISQTIAASKIDNSLHNKRAHKQYVQSIIEKKRENNTAIDDRPEPPEAPEMPDPPVLG